MTNCRNDSGDRLVKEEERELSEKKSVILTVMLVQLEFESKCHLVIKPFRFDVDPCIWADCIQNFKNWLHEKSSFTNYIGMEKAI